MPMRTNALISTSRLVNNVQQDTLVNVPAMLSVPGMPDHDQQGKEIPYVMLVAPDTDIQPGDLLVIVYWGQFTTPLNKRLRVVSADPSGGFADNDPTSRKENMRCRLSLWTGR